MGIINEQHHRRSIRLPGYDYSKPGLYFITICVQHHKCLLGSVRADLCVRPSSPGVPAAAPSAASARVSLSPAGNMVARWYLELENKFPDLRCREYVVMPNHFHCIVENTGTRKPQPEHDAGEQTATDELGEQHTADILGEHIGSPLHTVVQWFKTMTTNEYILGVKNLGWQRFDGKLWQRNYWEHIVRNDFDYDRIAKYIVDNPAKWNSDKFNVVGL